ncbi:C3a anaphylatoxin chemotactic receptor-like [Hyla sarda]|uniref:C3a anaphylatoxin chemotactic receptor-like n=1 Tax=Hyla sarda TaxID=327740 RepID=UPI0024C4015E|nr:C3a anaphylatoxin chemotactic receptor-like [Hyla sarda]
MSVTLYSIIFALGIIGNGLVIWIAGFRMKKTISAVWFLNLAIADFLCCASLSLRIAELVSHWENSRHFCTLSIFFFLLNMSASVLLLTAMSIDRCVSVMWPFWAKIHRTCKLVRISAAIIWVLSFLLTCILYYTYESHLNDLSEWCVLFFSYSLYFCDRKQAIQLIRLFIMFVIPFLIILISYYVILIKLRKSKRSRRSQRPYRIITAIILCFFICWCPYYIWPLTLMYSGKTFILHTVYIIIVNLACFNSCINPIIYVLMGQDFKHSFFRSIPSRLERALSDQPNDLCRESEGCQHVFTKYV